MPDSSNPNDKKQEDSTCTKYSETINLLIRHLLHVGMSVNESCTYCECLSVRLVYDTLIVVKAGLLLSHNNHYDIPFPTF